MSHIEAIRDVLIADATVAALVGTRVYPEVAPQGCERPFIIVNEISDAPQNGFTTTLATALRNVDIQVDSYAETKAGAIALSQAVEDALDVSGPDLSITLENSTTLYEDKTKLRRVSADYSVWRGR